MRASQRGAAADTLASQLASDRHSKAERGFFMRELQVIGGPEAVSELGKQLLEEELGQGAVQALLAIREGAPARFRKALAQAKGRNRLAILQALGVAQDTGSVKA